jgi:hypothetical protein
MTDQNIAKLAPLVVVVAAIVGGTVIARRRGYKIGGETVVRCRDGHLFTTLWIPGGSFKAIRLGFYRFQYCPVGRHWSLCAPVRDDDLTDADRESARLHHDTRIP